MFYLLTHLFLLTEVVVPYQFLLTPWNTIFFSREKPPPVKYQWAIVYKYCIMMERSL